METSATMGKPDLASAACVAARAGLVALSVDAVLRPGAGPHGRGDDLRTCVRGCRLLVGFRAARLVPLWLCRVVGGVPPAFRASDLRGTALDYIASLAAGISNEKTKQILQRNLMRNGSFPAACCFIFRT